MTIDSVTVVISSYVLPLMALWLKVVEMDGGRVVSEWGGGFETWMPTAIATSADGDIVVSNAHPQATSRLQLFTPDGRQVSVFLIPNSHRHARHDKTVLSVSCPLRWCELDSRQLRTVADRKVEV